MAGSSASLGSYTQKCLTDPRNCVKGLTISFWGKLKSFDANRDVEQFRFLGTHVDGVDEGVGLEFYFKNENSKIITFPVSSNKSLI